MIILDTSGVVALVGLKDPDHKAAAKAVKDSRPPFVIPAGTLAEIGHLVEREHGAGGLDLVLADIEDGAYELDCGEEDLPRIRELVARYEDLRLGFADASVIACAERRRAPVLTFDRRDFGVVAREGTITLVP